MIETKGSVSRKQSFALAIRTLKVMVLILGLLVVASAQTQRSPDDPRNQSPAVGTGGPPGGPTGLFTVFDGDTIRRGEFTFSIAYSNFDRDPGDVDITEIPLSFNLGLSDHVELFFQTTGYRGVKVNSPRNLSSFYLPNVQANFTPTLLGSMPALILAPIRVSGAQNLPSGLLFRPAFCPACIGQFPILGPAATGQSFFFLGGQPFVQFPFIGGVGPTFGVEGSRIAPRIVTQLGTPTGGGGNFGAASTFPGIGSIYGSILPGVVLTVRTIPPNLTFNTLVVPELFSDVPSYLPDAPFIGRSYGASSFGTAQVGAKIRFTGPDSALGLGIIPFYRWYLDKADDVGGFTQLQRGASPGGDIGDFGLIGFASGRLSRSVNVSANIGYILNSNPKSSAMANAILLDRPDEWLSGVAFDFPINKYFQLIGEVRATKYVGGRTPNAFNNDPVEALAGAKIYPARWWGIGGAYRRHLNQQSQSLFEDPIPVGFRPSDDPNGFIVQIWAGRRNARTVPAPLNAGPTISSVSSSAASLYLPCPPGTRPIDCTPSANMEVQLTAGATDPDNDPLVYTWAVNGGRLAGEGRSVSWDLSGLAPGTYVATVEVNDGNQHTVNGQTSVTIANCRCEAPCPVVSVSCPSDVEQGSPITFSASISGGDTSVSGTYNWSVSAGSITSGQGTSTITVDTTGIGGQTVTATVDVGGYAPACSTTASCSTQVRTPVVVSPVRFDEYGDIRFNDEKARLDNFAIELQNQPGSEGYIIGFGSCEGEGAARANRAKDYLVNTRGIDPGRIIVIDGGCRESLAVQLWIRPSGAAAPAAEGATVDPCPSCRRAPRRRGRRGDE